MPVPFSNKNVHIKANTAFKPGFMRYDGAGKFTFIRIKPWTAIKFIFRMLYAKRSHKAIKSIR